MLEWSRVFVLGAVSALFTAACQIEVEPEENQSPPQNSWPRAPVDEPPEDPWAAQEEPQPWMPAEPEPAGEPAPAQPVPEPSAPKPPQKPSVDPFRELVIVDVSVVSSESAAETNRAAHWSFRRMLRFLGGEGRESALAEGWLTQWETVTRVGPYAAPVSPRPGVRSLLIEPWFGPSAATGAPTYHDAAPTAASDDEVWANVPFQLIAIVNRIDLAERACAGSAGELRFIYTALSTARVPISMTVIVEIPYPATRTPHDWAGAWHALGAFPVSGAAYRAELGKLTDAVLRDADPLAARVRTNEASLGAGTELPWELREFRLDSSGKARSLVMVPLETTPRTDVRPALLASYLASAAEDVMDGPVSLPEELRGGAAQVSRVDFSWEAPSLSDSLRQAFSRNTCNGCHGGDSTTLPFQHIGPSLGSLRPGARLSPFLYDPARSTDDLRRRVLVLEKLLSTSCDEPQADYPK